MCQSCTIDIDKTESALSETRKVASDSETEFKMSEDSDSALSSDAPDVEEESKWPELEPPKPPKRANQGEREAYLKKRREYQRKQREAAAPFNKLKDTRSKELGRKLTWAEKNALSLEYHHPELKNVWGDYQAKIKPVVPTPMEAHPSLKLTLLPFQKESLFWMKKQEEGPWKGGMLADESE